MVPPWETRFSYGTAGVELRRTGGPHPQLRRTLAREPGLAGQRGQPVEPARGRAAGPPEDALRRRARRGPGGAPAPAPAVPAHAARAGLRRHRRGGAGARGDRGRIPVATVLERRRRCGLPTPPPPRHRATPPTDGCTSPWRTSRRCFTGSSRPTPRTQCCGPSSPTSARFAVHAPLPGGGQFADEGAANHIRLSVDGRPAMHLFAWGRSTWHRGEGPGPISRPADAGGLARAGQAAPAAPRRVPLPAARPGGHRRRRVPHRRDGRGQRRASSCCTRRRSSRWSRCCAHAAQPAGREVPLGDGQREGAAGRGGGVRLSVQQPGAHAARREDVHRRPRRITAAAEAAAALPRAGGGRGQPGHARCTTSTSASR